MGKKKVVRNKVKFPEEFYVYVCDYDGDDPIFVIAENQVEVAKESADNGEYAFYSKLTEGRFELDAIEAEN